MKYIEVDEELYRFIASKTERIGESASDILRRLLILPVNKVTPFEPRAIDEPSLDVAHHQASNLAASSKASPSPANLSPSNSSPSNLSPAASSQTHGNQTVSSSQEMSAEPSGQSQAKAPHNGYQPGQIEGHRSEPQALTQVHSEHLNANRSVMDFNALVNEHLLSQQKGAVGRFMWLLEGLAAMAPSQFNKVLLVQGKGRLYFARSKDELLASSASANPKEIGTTGYWVTTNNNTAKKQAILIEVLTKLHCDDTLATAISDRICDKLAE